MSHTHSVTIKIGLDSYAHIDGIPDTCNHKWDGDTVYYTQSGKRITPFTFINWASYTSSYRDRLIQDYQDRIANLK